jgi:hypothetical protein
MGSNSKYLGRHFEFRHYVVRHFGPVQKTYMPSQIEAMGREFKSHQGVYAYIRTLIFYLNRKNLDEHSKLSLVNKHQSI